MDNTLATRLVDAMRGGVQKVKAWTSEHGKGVELAAVLVSTVAAMVSVVSAVSVGRAERQLKERLEVAASLTSWEMKQRKSAGACALMLSQLTREQFSNFIDRKLPTLPDGARKYMQRCAASYERSLDAIGEKETLYIADQVGGQLNAYDTLSITWEALSPEAQKKICATAGMESTSPYRSYRTLAKGTKWWNFPTLEKFMDACVR